MNIFIINLPDKSVFPLVFLLFSLWCWGVDGFRGRLTRPLIGRMVSFPTCPPEELLLPCVCVLKGTEIHVRCESSETGRVQTSLDVLRRHQLPVEELYVVANRIVVIPSRFFSSLKIKKLFLMDNGVLRISRNAFNGLEKSLREMYIREPLLEDVPYDTFNNLKDLRALILEKTSLSHLPSLFPLSHLELFEIGESQVFEINPESFRAMPSLRKIEISRSQLNSLKDSSMQGLAYLKEITYAENNISWVHPGAFRNLEMVEKLSLSGNSIEDVGAIAIASRELKSLKVLDLSRNMIRFLSRGAFVDMPNLREIDLSNNLLEKIDHESMYKLPSLSRLDLSSNFIYHFETNVFNDVPSLEFLNLANNNLSFIMDMKYIYRSLPNLKTLDLSSNLVTGGNDISFGGHSKLETLILSKNFLKTLTKNLFRGLPNLRHLHLNQNKIKRETENRIWELQRLQVLDLSENDMKKIDGNLLSGLPNLIDLYISHNMIEDISSKAFLQVQELKSLNLSHNKIGKLHPNTFKPIANLFELDVSFNAITVIDGGLLSGLSTLEILHVSNNQVMNVDGKAFTDTVKLRSLDLSNNFLKHVPTSAINNLSSLNGLNLRNNAISAVRGGDFTHLRIVEALDLSNNHIQSLDRNAFAEMNVLKDLDISVNYIQAIPSNTFSNMKVMERLNASNNFIADVGPNAFGNMSRLRILDLSNNSLTFVGESIHDLPSLQGLFLNDNYINKLTNNSFINLPSLSVLFFSTNGLQTFETGTFYNLSSLMYLDLRNNSLVRVDSYLFSSLKMLKEIKLNQNQISSIEDYAFMNLPALQSLELQDNVIIHIGDLAFDRLSSLKFLNLSRNGLKEIPEKCLLKIPSLDVLDLSWNYLMDVDDSSFHAQQWLTVLLLDHNDLCHLGPKAFSGPRSLRVLTLHNNQLKRLHLSALREPIESLSLLDMSGNPFVCDCQLIWLREYLQQEEDRIVGHLQQLRKYSPGITDRKRGILPAFPSPMQGHPICAGPPQYAGMPITEVPPQAFFCHGSFRDLQSKREKCVPRFLDPQVFAEGNTEDELSEEVLNTLLKLSNLSDILPAKNEEPSYLDYRNPIVISGLSEAIANFSKHKNGEDQTPVVKDPKLSTKPVIKNQPNKQEDSGGLSSDFVTGDTPTIYAGSSSSSSSENKNGDKIKSGGLFGFKLPALPNILDTIGKIGLPSLGLNVDWGGLPSFGRGGKGSPPPNRVATGVSVKSQARPYREPGGMWVDIGSEEPPASSNPSNYNSFDGLSNKKPVTDILSNGKPDTLRGASGRGNNTNHGKFYDIFSHPISYIDNQDSNSPPENTHEFPPISFAEPVPDNEDNEEENPDFVHPFSSIKPGPSSGTPFLPGLVTNKKRPLPFIPNRNFYENRQKGENVPNSEIRGITPSSPSLKFPDDDYDNKDQDSWRWSPPDDNYPPMKASPHSPDTPFKPMKTFNPSSQIFGKVPHRLDNMNKSAAPFEHPTTTSASPLPNKHTNTKHDKIDFPFRNGPQQGNRGKVESKHPIPSKKAVNREMKTTTQIPTSTSTSPYDKWTKSFVNSFQDVISTIPPDLEATTIDFTSDKDVADFETTTSPGEVTEKFVPFNFLSNVLKDINATLLIRNFDDQNSLHPRSNNTTGSIVTTTPTDLSLNEFTSTFPSSVTTFETTSENSFVSDDGFTTHPPQWLYPTEHPERPEENTDNVGNRDSVRNTWWPPSSLGHGVTLVQGNHGQQTPNSIPVELHESHINEETVSHGVKHISPSRSISFGSGVPSVEKVHHSFAQGVNLPPYHEEEKDEQTYEPEVELITEAPRRKQAGIMDWYYSNYNKEYDPDRPLPVGGNGPPPSSSSPIINNTDLLSRLLAYSILLWIYFA